jgi:hypothetical protein
MAEERADRDADRLLVSPGGNDLAWRAARDRGLAVWVGEWALGRRNWRHQIEGRRRHRTSSAMAPKDHPGVAQLLFRRCPLSAWSISVYVGVFPEHAFRIRSVPVTPGHYPLILGERIVGSLL